MKPDLSRRNVRRLAHEYRLPEGAIRQMLTMEAGTNRGDVVETPELPQRGGLRFWLPVALVPVALTSIFLLAARLLS